MAFIKTCKTRCRTDVHSAPARFRLQFTIWHMLVLTTLLGIALASTMVSARKKMAIDRLRASAVLVEAAISRMSVGSYEAERHSTSSDTLRAPLRGSGSGSTIRGGPGSGDPGSTPEHRTN